MSPLHVVLAVAALGLLVTLVDLTRPTYRRLAVRSIARRRGEAVLVVVGALLGTAIISAALVVGDSFDGSIRDVARTSLGPVDLRVIIHGTDDVRHETLQLEDRLAHSRIDSLDGMLSGVSAAVVLDNGRRGDAQQIDPSSCVLEIDFAQGRRFGPDPAITGLANAGSTPSGNDVVISEQLADQLRLKAGDPLVVHVYGQSPTLHVRSVVPTVGLIGFCGVLAAPGLLEGLWASRSEAVAAAASQGPEGMVMVSLDGGVYDSVAHSDRAERQLAAAAKAGGFTNAEVTPTKKNRLDSATRNGSQMRSIFSGIGGFSVISGILLLVNLVIMLAEERKVEFGLLRAVGFRRSHLLRSFGLEGSLYAFVASVLGALVGIGVADLVIIGTRRIFSEPDRRFEIHLFAHLRTLLLAAAIGYAISIVTVWAASARISRLNIISALRDLPAPRRPHRHLGRIVAACVAVVAGVAASIAGVRGAGQIPLMAGVPIAAFAAIGATSQLIRSTKRPTRIMSIVMPFVAIGWTLGSFTIFRSRMNHAGIAVFVVMGVLLVTAAVILAVACAPVWGHLAASRSGRGALSARLGVAYPLARAGRTGLILAMFSLVVFTMAFMATLASTIDGQASTAARDLNAGYDVMVDSNLSNPVSAATLERFDGVRAATTFLTASPKLTNRYQSDPVRWRVSGFDDGLLRFRPPKLGARLKRFADDRGAFEAVLRDPTLIIVDDQFLLRGGGPKENGPVPGDRIVMTNERGERRTVRVAGVLANDAIFQGSLWSRAAVSEFLSPATAEIRAFVAAKEGATPTEVTDLAHRIEAATVDNGTKVDTFDTLVADNLGEVTAFMRLLEVYLAFGLVIGIAGLGVVMVRAARERRHEIGTLRAMGFPASVVARAFVIEALFISAGGVVIGVTLALVTAYQVAVNSSAFSIAAGSFTVSALAIALIVIAPIACSLLSVSRPARAVALIRPAAALRLPD